MNKEQRTKNNRNENRESRKLCRVSSGFTLIELLIVISIIGILTAISAFALVGSRESARDARRKTDLETIKSALVIYYADCSKYPPDSGANKLTFGSALKGDGSSTGCASTNTYLQKVPNDPISSRSYGYKVTGTMFQLCAPLEDVTTPDATNCAGVTCTGGNCSYGVTNQ